MSERKIQETCTYCEGNGYFQLITGGSTTCPACEGNGKSEAREPEMVIEKK
jgi:DnaJ-class molecular chaperone